MMLNQKDEMVVRAETSRPQANTWLVEKLKHTPSEMRIPSYDKDEDYKDRPKIQLTVPEKPRAELEMQF